MNETVNETGTETRLDLERYVDEVRRELADQIGRAHV